MTDSASPAFTEHRIELPDGRVLAAAETGPAGGPVVVLSHVAPGSRLFDPDPAATAAAGVRLVAVDRAGYGGSSPLPAGTAPSITGFADDLAAALRHLGIADAGVAGWSGGGRVAVALAARHPELVRAVAVVATPAPHEDVPWIPEENMAMMEPLRGDPATAVEVLTPVFADMAASPAAGVGAVTGGADDEAMLAADPGLRDRLEATMVEAFAQGPVGVAADIVSYTLVPWGFDPAAVGARTTAFYGEGDPIVTPAHGQWYVDRIPEAVLRVVPGVGHLVVVTAWADILAAVS
jgi:pimeloyl-ACP methyl ester carboxylesterase